MKNRTKDYQLIEKQLAFLEKEDDLYLIYQLFTEKILKKYSNEL